jgi:hypothetical protein
VAGWTDFAVVIGAATAALLGLLFVAVSIRAEPIRRSDALRNRSAETVALLLIGLLGAALLTVPGQDDRVLGVEYVVLAVASAVIAIVLDRRAGKTSSAFADVLDATNPSWVTCVLLLAAGIVLVLGHRSGLYVLIPALFAVLVGCVINAWLILVRLSD